MNEIKFLLNHRDMEFAISPDSSDFKKLKTISDRVYLDFIKENNGGLFFNRSLIIYGYTKKQEIYSLDKINEKINLEYGIISANNFFFACDIFGNQFCFDLQTGKVYLFYIDSGDKEFVANNFIEWIQRIEADIDHYTGQSFFEKWEESRPRLNYDERLTAKIPFILGGEYHFKNIWVEKLDKVLEFNANIAKQIFDLPDGIRMNINVVD